jgi:phospholipid/cholesterol/gamma-HCH transport system substrate-binding protein
MRYSRLEISVGLFVAAGLAALGALSLSVAGLPLVAPRRYPVIARFSSVGALRPGAMVAIAGVPVGKVGRIRLSQFSAEAALDIDQPIRLPADTIASIRTFGLLGETYVALSPGGGDRTLAPGGRILETEPAVDLIDLVSRHAFQRGEDKDLP